MNHAIPKYSITQHFLFIGLICLGYGLGSVGFNSFSRQKIFELNRTRLKDPETTQTQAYESCDS